MPIWKNYGENQRVHPGTVQSPRSLAEMQRCVKQASEQGRRVKCVGSAHSFRFRAAIQETLDPTGVFSNAYTRRVGIHGQAED